MKTEEIIHEDNAIPSISESGLTVCKWKYIDAGIFGCKDLVFLTSCGKEFDANKISRSKFCPNCGHPVS